MTLERALLSVGFTEPIVVALLRVPDAPVILFEGCRPCFRQRAVCSSLSRGNSMQFLLFAPLASPADSANLGLSKTPDYLFFILVIAQVNNHALFPLEPPFGVQDHVWDVSRCIQGRC